MKMIAMKTVYYGRKEYRVGQEFDVPNERDAAKMLRAHKAKAAPVKPGKVDLPKSMKAEEFDAPKKSGGRGRTYQRRDMTATDGQTGEEIPLPSSLADPPSSEPTSDNSGEESAS